MTSIFENPSHAQEPEPLADRLARTLGESAVPQGLHDGLIAYLLDHRPPGSFLCAALSNDLLEAVKRGDDQSRAHLVDLTLWLYEEAPITSWGSPARVRVWLQGVESK